MWDPIEDENELKKIVIEDTSQARIGGGMSLKNKKDLADYAIIGKRKSFQRHPSDIILGHMKQ